MVKSQYNTICEILIVEILKNICRLCDEGQFIRSKDTKPELLVRKFLFSKGFRYRLNVKKLPGSPDIVLKKYRTAIFINGCFWHGHHDCKYFTLPKSNTLFWQDKIQHNRDRDLKRRIELRDMGWHTITLWECQLKPKVLQQTMNGLEKTLCHIYLEDKRQFYNSTYYYNERVYI